MMSLTVSDRIRLVIGDITGLRVDAIVNAANESLQGSGLFGVDAAIHRAGGYGLTEECHAIGGCPTGQVRLTGGHQLPARYVIHTVGPMYRGGQQGEARLLESCYRESLRLAAQHGIRTIAFPCIATGIFGYPKEEACRIAVAVVFGWLAENELPAEVVFCCFRPEDADLYQARLGITAEAIF
jgi:O-acetyl-ADP-ribose deacetylase